MQSHSERCWVFFFLRELYKTISRNLESRTRRFWAHACGLWELTLHMMGRLWAEHNELRQVQPKRILEDPTLPLYITWTTTDDCRLAIRTCDVVTSTPSSFMRGVYLVSYPSSLICNKRCTLACSRRILWKTEKKASKTPGTREFSRMLRTKFSVALLQVWSPKAGTILRTKLNKKLSFGFGPVKEGILSKGVLRGGS
jgi:hypothetical protein